MKKMSLIFTLVLGLVTTAIAAPSGNTTPRITTEVQAANIIHRVDNIAALRQLTGGPGKIAVQVLGYYSPGDGGHGNVRYWGAASTCVDNGGSCLDPVASGAGRWLSGPDRNPLSWGAKGDGVADDLSFLLSQLADGVGISSPPGRTYRISAPLVVTTNNTIADLNHSTLELDDPTGLQSNLILGDGVTQKTGIKIKNIVFTRRQAATAGAAIHLRYAGVTDVSGCRIYGNNKIYNGIFCDRTIITNINDNYIDNCLNFGISLQGADATALRTVDTTIRGNRIEGGVTGIRAYDYVEGLYVRDNILYGTSGACASVSASSLATGLFSFKFQENDFDTCGAAGLYLDKVNNVQITGSWFSNNVGIDLDVTADTNSVLITYNQIYPTNHGIRVAGVAARIDGNLISGGLSSVYVKSTATITAISNNTLRGAGYGINLAENPSGVQLVANNISGMSLDPISDAATPNTRYITGNVGDTAVGIAGFITVGASPFVYTTGGRPESLSISSGTVSNIVIDGDSIGFGTNRSFTLPPNTAITVTYSSIPFMVRLKL